MFHRWKKGVVSEAIGNVWASGAVFTATIGAGRELWVGISGSDWLILVIGPPSALVV